MKIFVTRRIPKSGLEALRAAGHEVAVSEKDGVLTQAELIERLRREDPDAVLCLLTDRVDGAVFDAAPRAKIFANYAVGFDNIDLEAAAKRSVVVTNTPDVLTEAVAEYTVSLILSLARRIVEADGFARAGSYQGWDPLLLLGMELQGKTLGIVGGGRIGARAAEIMQRGFGMRVMYHDQRQNAALESALGAVFAPTLDELLPEADVVSIHLPLTDATRHLFNAAALAKMKPSALLINTARGPIVEEAVLARALESGLIAGAAIDVFEAEPAITPDLLPLPNVIITPHIASATLEARARMSLIAAENIKAVLSGEPALNPVPVVQ